MRTIVEIVVAAVIALVAVTGHQIDARTQAARYRMLQPTGKLVAYADSPYQNLNLGKYLEQYSLFAHGELVGSFPDPFAAAGEAALVLSQHPSPQRVLVISPIDPELLAAVLDWNVERLDLVEIDPKVYEMVKPHLPARATNALREGRLVFNQADARRFVAQAPAARFDVVYLSLPHPTTALINRFFTKEFYGEVARALRRDGVIVLRVPGAETFTSILQGAAGAIYATMKRVFNEIVVLQGPETYFFAAKTPGVSLTRDSRVLAARHVAAGAPETSFGPEDYATYYIDARLDTALASLKNAPQTLNTDVSPKSFFYSLALWDRYSDSRLSRAAGFLRRVGPGLLIVGIAVFAVGGASLLRGETRRKAVRFFTVTAIALVGFCAMAVELVTIYMYQVRFGTVYRKIGLLVAVFMFGLTISALLARRIIARSPRAAMATAVALLLMCAGVALHLIVVALPEVVFFARLFACAFATGFVFPLAVMLYQERRQTGVAAGVIDAADHLGSAVGALCVGVFLFPLLGAMGIARFLAAAFLACAGLLVLVYLIRRDMPPAG